MNQLTIKSHNIQGIFIRSIQLEDVTTKYVSWLNDSKVNQYLETRFHKQDIDSVKNYISLQLNNPLEQLFTIRTSENKHIGNIKIGSINTIHNVAQVSLFIGDKKFWGKGYASQAIRLVSQYSFQKLRLRKLTASAYTSNIGSIKAFLKAGYENECILKEHYILDGKPSDVVFMSLFKKPQDDFIELVVTNK